MAIILDGKAMTDRVAVHTHLAQRLELPEYYGRNLDALYDVLSELTGEILLEDSAAVIEQLGRYGESLLATMREAAEANPGLHVTIK